MDYLGKIGEVPLKIEKDINSSRKFFNPIAFYFKDNDEFNSFYFKINKLISDSSDKNNGRCIVEDNTKCKYIIDIEQVNFFHGELCAEVFICNSKKIK